MPAEDAVVIAIPIVWGAFFGLPLVGLKIPMARRPLFEKMSSYYFRFTTLFTIGAFLCLLGDANWTTVLNFILSGNLWCIRWGVPAVMWIVSGYYLYSAWRDLIDGLRGETNV